LSTGIAISWYTTLSCGTSTTLSTIFESAPLSDCAERSVVETRDESERGKRKDYPVHLNLDKFFDNYLCLDHLHPCLDNRLMCLRPGNVGLARRNALLISRVLAFHPQRSDVWYPGGHGRAKLQQGKTTGATFGQRDAPSGVAGGAESAWRQHGAARQPARRSSQALRRPDAAARATTLSAPSAEPARKKEDPPYQHASQSQQRSATAAAHGLVSVMPLRHPDQYPDQ